MSRQRSVKAADLFCGAGGTSTGLLLACNEIGAQLDLLAINHWNIAIDTHTANHPHAQHLCESLDNVDPRKVVEGGRLNVLVASPECTHQPFMLGQQSGSVPRSVGQPVPTIATDGAIALVEPYLVKYNGTAKAQRIGEPLDTVTTKDRHGLVECERDGYRLDIRFRMLQPAELARAQGFEGYEFKGNREAVVKQIGNAVPVNLAKALCREVLQ